MNGIIINIFILISFLLICSSKIYKWSFISQDISYISLTLNWILVIPNFTEMVMYYYASFIQSMSSVERMITNVDKETFEGPLKSKQPVKFNKSKGIQIQNVFSKYRTNLPFVLKGITMHIKQGEKVALVGRTGSGKSSMLLALTRILNIQNSSNYEKISKFQNIHNLK
jgi:ABC-type multidrug transport system fused ATPase/permease subunit